MSNGWLKPTLTVPVERTKQKHKKMKRQMNIFNVYYFYTQNTSTLREDVKKALPHSYNVDTSQISMLANNTDNSREKNDWTWPFRLREPSLHLVQAIVHASISANASSSVSAASEVFSRISCSSYTQDKALCVCVCVHVSGVGVQS